MYKHYIRINENGYIVNGFSDAFADPEENDICINEEGGRHFELKGEVNPQLLNEAGQPLFIYENEAIRKLTEEEITVEVEKVNLPIWKSNKVTESKNRLEEYLSNNPYLFTDGKFYSVTKDKQNLLANAISVYQMKVQAGEIDPVIKWNATGEECTEWAINDIMALALSIAAYVEPLVALQQKYEIQINACATKADLESLVIDYEAIH